MQIIGENIHIISPKVKEGIANRDGTFFVDLARRQMQAGAWALDLNIGPQKKAGHEIMPWLVKGVQEAVDVPICLDTTNLVAIEEGLKVAKHQCIINSVSAEEERLEVVPPLAKKYNSKLIALTMGKGGIPVSAAGSIVAGIGVAGAPSSAEDHACAQAGISAVSAALELAE